MVLNSIKLPKFYEVQILFAAPRGTKVTSYAEIWQHRRETAGHRDSPVWNISDVCCVSQVCIRLCCLFWHVSIWTFTAPERDVALWDRCVPSRPSASPHKPLLLSSFLKIYIFKTPESFISRTVFRKTSTRSAARKKMCAQHIFHSFKCPFITIYSPHLRVRDWKEEWRVSGMLVLLTPARK